MQNVLSIILLLGAIQGIVLGVILFNSKLNKTQNRVFSTAIIFVSIALFSAYFQVVFEPSDYPFVVKSTFLLPLIFVPLIYIYTLLITKENKELTWVDLKYFLPFVVLLIYNLPFYFADESVQKAFFDEETLQSGLDLKYNLEFILVDVIITSFTVLIVAMVLKMRRNYEDNVSNYCEEVISFMRSFSWSIFGLTAIGLLFSILQLFNITYPYILDFITAIGSTILIYYMGYYMYLHPHIFNSVPEEKEVKLVNTNKKINDIMYDDYAQKIISLMEEGAYKNPELTLQLFSEKLGIPSYLVSKIINSKLNMNFYNFVNKYRIEEVKRELKSQKSPQIMTVAFAAGFNTKSSFYNYFKKNTGVSPKDYLK